MAVVPAFSSVSPDAVAHKPGIGVEIRQARLAFGTTVLFDGLDLTLAAGRLTCLLGTSGVGKSSLLRLIAGLVDGAGTTLEAATLRCSDGGPISGRVSYMGQSDMLLPWLSVLENAVLGARLRGDATAAVRARARTLLEEVGLGPVLSARPAALSGGMRQRAALVRTLMEDRPIVLMDEPFASLDAITKLKLQEIAARLLAGRTILLVTHDPLEALRLSDEIWIMAGRPARLGTPIEPAGMPPRDVADPAVLRTQALLLTQLGQAQDFS